MFEQEHIDLAKHRLSVAFEDHNAAISLSDSGHFKAANNRAYYSIFHSIRAVLALEGKDFKKHSALISYFNQYYIHTGIFKREYAKIISGASTVRNASDYNDFYLVDKNETLAQIENAHLFYTEVKAYLDQKFLEVAAEGSCKEDAGAE